jgi:hypothetical protein
MIDLGTLKVLNTIAANRSTANAAVLANEWATRDYFQATRDERALNRRAALLARHIQEQTGLPCGHAAAKALIQQWDREGREVRS